MNDYEFRKDGQPITVQDFGRVLAGAFGEQVVVQLVNTSANDWSNVVCSLQQGDTEGGYGTAAANGVDLNELPQDVGPLAAGASIDLRLGWVTPAGSLGHTTDFAALIVDYTY